MGATLKRPSKKSRSPAWKCLPPRMRVLYITTRHRTGGWLAEAFAQDTAVEIDLQETLGSASGLARLREDAYDAVLVSHDPGELDALELIEGYRAGGADEPIVVLGIQSEQEMATLCYEVGADGYACANTTTTRSLIWIVARAIQRHQLVRENRRLSEAERQRLQREHDEANQLLGQQRTLIADLETIRHQREPSGAKEGDRSVSASRPSVQPSADARSPAAPLGGSPFADELAMRPRVIDPLGLPGELVRLYRELLRAYVIMGSGSLAGELRRLSQLLCTAGVTAEQTMQLHLHVLEELVHGLGARSTRHVMTRADLLVLEIMLHLAEGYRLRYLDRARPPVQRLLPGFDDPAPVAF